MHYSERKFTEVQQNWIDYFSGGKRRNSFWISIAFLTIVLIILPNFLQFVETREGVVLEDPLLNLFRPVEVTWITFLIIYSSLTIAIVHFLKNPKLLHTAILTYAFIAVFRMIAMYMLPLNPPNSILLLNDPFVQLFGTGEILTKDLFFSGHTSTLFMLFLITKKKNKLKNIFLTGTIVVAVFVILQHVHYSIDVFAAPFFTFASYKTALFFIER